MSPLIVFIWMAVIFFVIGGDVEFIMQSEKHCKFEILKRSSKKDADRICFIIPGIWPPKGSAYLEMLKNYPGEVRLLQENLGWFPNDIEKKTIDQTVFINSCEEVDIIDISLGSHATIKELVYACHWVNVYHLNPTSQQAIRSIPRPLMIFAGVLAEILLTLLGFLNFLPVAKIGGRWRTLGFVLSRVSDCFLSKRINDDFVRGVILSGDDQFFHNDGNKFLRQYFSEKIGEDKVITTNATHADVEHYAENYREALEQLGFPSIHS